LCVFMEGRCAEGREFGLLGEGGGGETHFVESRLAGCVSYGSGFDSISCLVRFVHQVYYRSDLIQSNQESKQHNNSLPFPTDTRYFYIPSSWLSASHTQLTPTTRAPVAATVVRGRASLAVPYLTTAHSRSTPTGIITRDT
jgi:hypothetical protein